MLATRPRFRPSFDCLEERQLLAVQVTAPLPTGTADPLHQMVAAQPAIQVDHGLTAGPAADSKAASPRAIVWSVVTIRNQTNGTVNYQFQWPNGSWQSYSLGPNQYRYHWIAGSNVSASIRYDYSFAPGYQEQRYNLTSKDVTHSPSGPGDGLSYDFRLNSNRSGLVLLAEVALNKSAYANERHTLDNLHESNGQLSFPNLLSNYEVLAPSTGGSTVRGAYNCIAWTLGITNRWVWPGDTIAAFDQLYGSYGYRRMSSLDFSVHPGMQKIVLYATWGSDGRWHATHGAKQESNGTYTSKLGGLALIRALDPYAVDGPSYGQPIAVYYRYA